MARANAYVVVDELAVAAFIAPGGEVYDLIWDVAKLGALFAVNHIHSRTGRLAGNNKVNRPKPDGVLKIGSLLYNNLKYAKWVHGGVDHRIYPIHGDYLAIPRNTGGVEKGGELRKLHAAGGPKLYRLVQSVRGQDANPFLAKGVRDAMAAQGLY